MGDWIMDFIANMFEGMNGISTAVVDMMKFDDTVLNFMANIYNWILPLAYSIIVLYFLIEVTDKASSSNYTLEMFLKSFIKLMIAEIIISHAMDIISVFIGFSNWALDSSVNINISATANSTTTDYSEFNNLGFIEKVFMFIPMLITYLLSKIATVVIYIMVISTKIEIILRGGFMCLALSTISENGMKSSGIKYIKKFLGCMLYGASIILVLKITTYLQISSSTIAASGTGLALIMGWITSFFSSLIYPFAAVGAIAVSKTVLNDVLGA